MDAATIRNIAKHANVLPPQIYKHVGNIEQLLDDVAYYLWETRPRTRNESDDPIEGLHHEIEDLIIFGLINPELYLHISKPRAGQLRTLWRRQVDDLSAAVSRVAKVGLLQVGEKQAVEFILPYCVGMIFTCLHETSRPRDVHWLGWQAIKPLLKKGMKSNTKAPEALKADTDRKAPTLASQLKANLGEVKVLSLAESIMLKEWLERIASG